MGFFVKFWGTRGSIPTPGWKTRKYGGNTSCYEVRIGDSLFILDGGTGLRELGANIMKTRSQAPVVAHMFFSHPHWDHIQGFPFFAPAYVRRNTFHIYDRVGAERSHFELLSGQMKSDYFPVEFSELSAKVLPAAIGAEGGVIDGVKISWMRQIHPGGSLAWRFEKDGIVCVFATDNELDKMLANADEVALDPMAPRRVSEDYLQFIRGADLLIADGQYTDEEYAEKVGWGHPRATTLVDAALTAGVRRLAVSHHDPMQTDEDVEEKIARCRRRAERYPRDLAIFAAREKIELRLDDGPRTVDDE